MQNALVTEGGRVGGTKSYKRLIMNNNGQKRVGQGCEEL